MAKKRIYLTDDQVAQIIGTSRKECWICGMLQSNIKITKKDLRCYLRESVISDDGIEEHLRQLIGDFSYE